MTPEQGKPWSGSCSSPISPWEPLGTSWPHRCPGVTLQSSSDPGAASFPVLPKAEMLKWGNSRGHWCWGLAWLAPLGTWGSSASWFSPPSPHPATVSVTCGHAWLAVVVPAGFLGSRVASGELTLGSGCGVTTADGDGYWLKHLLVGCGTTLEVRSQGWPRVPDGGSAAAWSSLGWVEDGSGGTMSHRGGTASGHPSMT